MHPAEMQGDNRTVIINTLLIIWREFKVCSNSKMLLLRFSINLLAFYHECCSLNGYALTIYSVIDSEYRCSMPLLTKFRPLPGVLELSVMRI